MLATDREGLLGLLLDLKHDLGKYLILPFGYLPKGAPIADVRAALTQALCETRKSQSGSRSAASLWQAFCAATPSALHQTPQFQGLAATVATALSWQARLDDPALDRAAIERDLGAVSKVIAAWLQDVESAPTDDAPRPGGAT